MKIFCVEVEAPLACFTRPELKVERMSYDIPTPSAIKGVFDAIFWKPAIKWIPVRMQVINPIKFISIKRNEVKKAASTKKDGFNIEEHRTQRSSLILEDVKYRFWARFEYIESQNRVYASSPKKAIEESDERERGESPDKYYAIFLRRASRGQCFHQPYLGCREFSCSFELVDPESNPAQSNVGEEYRDLGIMVYDTDYSTKPVSSSLYRPVMKDGFVEIPHPESNEVYR